MTTARHEPKNVEDPVEVHLRSVPRWLRDLFKAECARRGVSMREAIIGLIEKEIHSPLVPNRSS